MGQRVSRLWRTSSGDLGPEINQQETDYMWNTFLLILRSFELAISKTTPDNDFRLNIWVSGSAEWCVEIWTVGLSGAQVEQGVRFPSA